MLTVALLVCFGLDYTERDLEVQDGDSRLEGLSSLFRTFISGFLMSSRIGGWSDWRVRLSEQEYRTGILRGERREANDRV